MVKDKLTDLCGNLLWQNDFINTFHEIRPDLLDGHLDVLCPLDHHLHRHLHYLQTQVGCVFCLVSRFYFNFLFWFWFVFVFQLFIYIFI